MKTKKRLVGHCAVDSGMIMIVDPCYVIDPEDPPLYTYDAACNVSLSEKRAGELKLVNGSAATCVVSATNIGDGSFPVFANYDKNGRIVSLTIEF